MNFFFKIYLNQKSGLGHLSRCLILAEQIPVSQKRIKDLIAQKGESEISKVNVGQAYSGLRGIKAFVCDTSAVDPDKGLIIRGMPLLDIKHISPEEVFYLLIAGKLPTEEELVDLKSEFSESEEIPDWINIEESDFIKVR